MTQFLLLNALKAIYVISGPFPCAVHFTAVQNEKAPCFGTKGGESQRTYKTLAGTFMAKFDDKRS